MFPRGPRPPMGNMMNMRGFHYTDPYARQPLNKGAGGLLSKLFNKSRPGSVASQSGMLNNFINQAPTSQGTSNFLSNLLSNPSGMMTNIQKVMDVANHVGPMIQQYGPMMRNIPALIRLYTELNSSDDEESNKDEDKENEEAKVLPFTKEKKKDEKTRKTNKGSSPKLYI
jgi:hypothetical protein